MYLSTVFPLLSLLASLSTVAVMGDDGPTGAIRLRGGGGGEQQQQRQLTNAAGKCHDLPRPDQKKWYDSESFFNDCEWYGESEDRCEEYGNERERFGYVAQQACCACKGGYSFPPGPTTIQDGTDCITLVGTPADGINVVMATCDGSDSQKWIINESRSEYPPNDPVLIVKSYMDTGYCLDASKTFQNPTNMQVWTCKAAEKSRYNQEFDTLFWLEHRKLLTNSGYCLTWENFKDDTNSDMNLVGEDKGGHKYTHCKTTDIPEFAFIV